MKFINKIKSSVTLKLWLTFFITAVLIFIILSVGFGGNFRKHFGAKVKPHLDLYTQYFLADIGNPPDYDKAQRLSSRLNIIVKIKDGEFVWSSDGNVSLPEVYRKPRFGKHHYGEHALLLQNGSLKVYVIEPEHDDFDDTAGFWVALVLVLTVLVAAYIYTMLIFKPINNEINHGLGRIGDGDFSHKIGVNRNDIIGKLADDINNMSGRIKGLIDSKQDLLLAVSHELRSPLTRANVSLALLPDSKAKDSIGDDLKELNNIINDILDAQYISSNNALNRKNTDINQIVNEVLADNFKGVDIVFESQTVPNFSLDITRIKLLLKNLLANSVRYNNPEKGAVMVGTNLENESLVLRVSDNGVGIKSEHLDRLKEAFYRPDTSRDRATGGLGLGLYLCDQIAKAHGGVLEIKSTIYQGSEFKVIIPNG
jgi:signal transduction histidine kinase